MLSFGFATRIFLYSGVADLRKSFGLTAMVRNELDGDPLSGHVFGFSNRRRTLIKLLVWDGSGYWILNKRLERGTFSWPSSTDASHELTPDELTLLLGGIELRDTSQKRWHRYRMSS